MNNLKSWLPRLLADGKTLSISINWLHAYPSVNFGIHWYRFSYSFYMRCFKDLVPASFSAFSRSCGDIWHTGIMVISHTRIVNDETDCLATAKKKIFSQMEGLLKQLAVSLVQPVANMSKYSDKLGKVGVKRRWPASPPGTTSESFCILRPLLHRRDQSHHTQHLPVHWQPRQSIEVLSGIPKNSSTTMLTQSAHVGARNPHSALSVAQNPP